MDWKTKISVHKDGDMYVRGRKLTDLVGKTSFTEALFFVLRGRMPEKTEAQMLDAILVITIEHGINVPTAFVGRSVASTGNPLNASLAAGVLSVGDYHGGAIEQAMRLLAENKTPKQIVKDTIKQGKKIPGYGHKIYKEKDPRAETLYKTAINLKFPTEYFDKAYEIEKELQKETGVNLPLNIDGAIAAILLQLGFDWRIGKAFFILGRMPGMIAHIEEEMRDEKPYRRIDDKDVKYIGPEIKL